MGKTLARKTTRKAAAESRTAARSRSRSPKRESAGAIKTYRAALNFLNQHTNHETRLRVSYNAANFNLSRMLRLLSGIGNPHRKIRTIHIAGTKGKGSTAHMVAAMLQHCGLRTGLYTSPHILNLRERIRINGQMISEAEFTRLMARLAPAVRKLAKNPPTFFEILTAMAFLHFARQEVDIAVIETGLGGRLDSTNVIKPEVCGITNISYDHMAQLGSTLEKIAEEKAGIFKPGVPGDCAPQKPEVVKVLRKAAERVGCELRVLGEDVEFSYRFESSRATGPQNRVCMATASTRYDHVPVPLLGEHQAYNCGVALGIVDALRERGFEIDQQQALDGLARVRIEGRLELIRDFPRTVVDAAHNAESIRALMRAIGQNIGYDSMVVIFGCSADKDIDGMLKQLEIGADKVIFTSNGTPRSADPHDLHARFTEQSPKMAQVEPTLEEAFATAMRCVSRDDLICITGSVYLVGLAKQKLAEPAVV